MKLITKLRAKFEHKTAMKQEINDVQKPIFLSLSLSFGVEINDYWNCFYHLDFNEHQFQSVKMYKNSLMTYHPLKFEICVVDEYALIF